MKISSESTARLATLSKLDLSPAELEQLSDELETVVNYVDILSQLPPEPAECIQAAPPPRNVFREDRVVYSRDRAELLSNAPETDGETFAVPKTVD